MNRRTIFVAIFVCAFLCALPAWPQQKAKSQPDNLLLRDGERLIGQVTGGDSSKLEFHSDLVGDVAVKWSDVQ